MSLPALSPKYKAVLPPFPRRRRATPSSYHVLRPPPPHQSRRQFLSPKPLSHLFFTPTQCLSLLESHTRTRSLAAGKQLHALILSSGVLLLHRASPLIATKLAAMYSFCGHPSDARHLFDQIPEKTPFLWNAIIRGHVQSGIHFNALLLFSQMVSSGCRPDNFTYPFALKACGDLSLLQTGTQIHRTALASGFGSNEFVQNSLIAMYMNCGQNPSAMRLFDLMGNRSVVSWNTVIAGLFQNGCPTEALTVFDQMVDSGMEIDQATVVSVLPACAHLKDLQRGRQVHELAVAKGLGVHTPVRNSLIDMYSKCRSLEEARRVFDNEMWGRDVVSWTSMIGGYASNGFPTEALALSHWMQSSGIRPNSVTMASLLSACTTAPYIDHGKCIHGSCIRLLLDSNIIVETSIIDMYAKCGSMGSSLGVFARCSRRTATWNAVVSSYTRNGQAREAIEHFKLMLTDAVPPDLATMASVLPAYGDSADLRQAKNIHGYLTRMGFLRCVEATTSLIHVYAKAGCLKSAWDLFDALPMKDMVSWSAVIAIFGMHGHARMAIGLLDQMVESGVEPNEVTFTSVLYSCSHAGLVDEGLEIFERMLESGRLKPTIEHYACVVDLLGRAGKLDEALRVIETMPLEPNHAVWGALLGACVIHENVQIGETAAKNLFAIEPENTGNYVLLGNIYAAVGWWDDVENVRRLVVERGLTKAPGCSSVEVRNL